MPEPNLDESIEMPQVSRGLGLAFAGFGMAILDVSRQSEFRKELFTARAPCAADFDFQAVFERDSIPALYYSTGIKIAGLQKHWSGPWLGSTALNTDRFLPATFKEKFTEPGIQIAQGNGSGAAHFIKAHKIDAILTILGWEEFLKKQN